MNPWRLIIKFAAGLFGAAALFVLALQLVYAGKALPGTHSGTLDLAGRSEADIAARLTEQRSFKQLSYTYQGQTYTFPAEQIGLSANPKATAAEAIADGHGRGLSMLFAPLQVLVRNIEVPQRYQLNETVLQDRLHEQTKNLVNPTKNATIVRSGRSFTILKEEAGQVVDLGANVTAARLALNRGETSIPLYIRPSQPAIEARSLQPARAYAEMLATRPVTVTGGDRVFHPPADTTRSWITFTRQDTSVNGRLLADLDVLKPFDDRLGIGIDDKPIVSLEQSTLYADVSREQVGQYIADVAGAVDHPPVNARLSFANNQLQIAGQPKDGVVLDRQPSVAILADAVRSGQPATLPSVVKPADIRAETLPTLGITGLIGTSTTTFGGSPTNRVFNIGVGAAKFDGTLIKPGENFSFNGTLGDVGPETGYRPELVIKENKTVPEYGGGLCQVSTTMFRAAMGAGLPITDRSNHSYAVHYYAPIGMDATIYPPNPDMKFRNNTGHYILVQTHQEGTSLTYDFYGTSDGRKSDTQILYINATEAAGGTAAFKYTVTGGTEPLSQTFNSTYKPQSAFPIGRSLN